MQPYGTVNTAYVRSWLDREDDQPMWALNLMRYRPLAQYADGRPTTLTGMQADDLYAPHDALAAVGARSLIRAPVLHQLMGDGARWDRVAVARYPTRRSQIEMNRMDAFQDRHAHKVAGMEFTIVLATFLPRDRPGNPDADQAPTESRRLLLQVVADASAPDLARGLDARRIAVFDVEDSIIGDARKFAQVRWDEISLAAAEELAARPFIEDPASYALIVTPQFDRFTPALA